MQGTFARNSGECEGSSGEHGDANSPNFAELASLCQTSHEGAQGLVIPPGTCLKKQTEHDKARARQDYDVPMLMFQPSEATEPYSQNPASVLRTTPNSKRQSA